MSHASVSTPFLGFLLRLLHPAELVGIFPGVLGDAAALEGAEDVVLAVVFREVYFVARELVLVVGDLVFGGFQGGAGIGYGFGFGVWVVAGWC